MQGRKPEYVHEEIEHIREGKHSAHSTKQAILPMENGRDTELTHQCLIVRRLCASIESPLEQNPY